MAIVIRNGVIANAYGCFRADILIKTTGLHKSKALLSAQMPSA